jgi:preprotein translocase subunit SecA
LEYDDIANEQRRIIYQMRDELLTAVDISKMITDVRAEVIDSFISRYIAPDSVDTYWDLSGLEAALLSEFHVAYSLNWVKENKAVTESQIREKIIETFARAYADKEAAIGESGVFRDLEKRVMLDTLDRLWREHLANMDHLRQGVGLRGYAQKNPKHEYKRECFSLFEALLDNIRFEVIRLLSIIEVRKREEVEAMEEERQQEELALKNQFQTLAGDISQSPEGGISFGNQQIPQAKEGVASRVGRNEVCPCGSGKKYKHCHGQV